MRDYRQDERGELRGHHHAHQRRREREDKEGPDGFDDANKSAPTRAGRLVEDERRRATGLRRRHSAATDERATSETCSALAVDWSDRGASLPPRRSHRVWISETLRPASTVELKRIVANQIKKCLKRT